MSVVEEQRSLDQLADTANEQAALAEACDNERVQHAIKAGHALHAAKKQVGHSNWEKWVANNFDKGIHTARAYMRLASKGERALDSNSIRQALKAPQSNHNSTALDAGETDHDPEDESDAAVELANLDDFIADNFRLYTEVADSLKRFAQLAGWSSSDTKKHYAGLSRCY